MSQNKANDDVFNVVATCVVTLVIFGSISLYNYVFTGRGISYNDSLEKRETQTVKTSLEEIKGDGFPEEKEEVVKSVVKTGWTLREVPVGGVLHAERFDDRFGAIIYGGIQSESMARLIVVCGKDHSSNNLENSVRFRHGSSYELIVPVQTNDPSEELIHLLGMGFQIEKASRQKLVIRFK